MFVVRLRGCGEFLELFLMALLLKLCKTYLCPHRLGERCCEMGAGESARCCCADEVASEQKDILDSNVVSVHAAAIPEEKVGYGHTRSTEAVLYRGSEHSTCMLRLEI